MKGNHNNSTLPNEDNLKNSLVNFFALLRENNLIVTYIIGEILIIIVNDKLSLFFEIAPNDYQSLCIIVKYERHPKLIKKCKHDKQFLEKWYSISINDKSLLLLKTQIIILCKTALDYQFNISDIVSILEEKHFSIMSNLKIIKFIK